MPALLKFLRYFLVASAGLIILLLILGWWSFDHYRGKYQLTAVEWDWQWSGRFYAEGLKWHLSDETSGEVDRLEIVWQWSELWKGSPGLRKISLQGANILFSSNDRESNVPNFKLQQALVEDSQFKLISGDDSLLINAGLIKLDKLQIGETYQLGNLTSANTSIYHYPKAPPAEGPGQPLKLSDIPEISIGNITIRGAQYRQFGPEKSLALRLSYLDLTGLDKREALSSRMDSVYLVLGDSLAIGSSLDSASWREGPQGMVFYGLKFQTEGLQLQIPKAQIWPDFSFATQLDLTGKISYAAISKIYPYLEEIIHPRLPRDSSIQLAGRLSVKNSQLEFHNFKLATLRSTNVSLAGSINWQEKETRLNLQLYQLTTSRNDLQEFLYPLVYQEYFSWPAQIKGNVHIGGTTNQWLVAGELQTTTGLLQLYSKTQWPNEADIHYLIEVSSRRARLGELADYLPIRLGEGELNLRLGGIYSELPQRDTFRMELILPKFSAEGYDLSALNFSYFFNAEYDSLWCTVNDPSLVGSLKGAYYPGDTATVHFLGLIDQATPGLLENRIPHWSYQTPYRGRYRYDDEDYIEVSVNTGNGQMHWTEGPPEDIGSWSLQLTGVANKYALKLNLTPDNQLELALEMPENEISRSGILETIYSFPYLKAEGRINLAEERGLNLSGLKVGVNHGSFSFEVKGPERRLFLNADIERLTYQEMEWRQISTRLRQDSLGPDAELAVEAINYADISLDSGRAILSSHDDRADLDISFGEVNGLGPLNLSLQQFRGPQGGYRIQFNPQDSLELVGKKWTIANNTGLVLDSNFRPVSGSLSIAQGTSSLSLTTAARQDLRLEVKKLPLAGLLQPFYPDLALQAEMNGSFSYNLESSRGKFAAQLSDLSYDSLKIGELKLDGSILTDSILAQLQLVAANELSQAVFIYHPEGLDYTLNINKLDLALLESVLTLPVWKLQGLLSSEMRGSYAGHNLGTGWLQVQQGSFILPTVNTRIEMAEDSLRLVDNTFEFDHYRLFDPDSIPLFVDGQIALLPEPDFQLGLASKGFSVLNQYSNPDLNGHLQTDVDLKLSGNLKSFSSEGVIRMRQGGYLKYKLPDEVQLTEKGGDLQFVSFKQLDSTLTPPAPRKLDINLDVDLIVEESDLHLLIDEVTQEYLRIAAQGEVRISKTGQQHPLLFGELSSERGRSRIELPLVPSVNLDIEKIKLSWAGAYDEPRISFVGSEQFRTDTKGISALEHHQGIVPVSLQLSLQNASIEQLEPHFALSSDDQVVNQWLQNQTEEQIQNLATNLLLFGTFSLAGSDGSDVFLSASTSKLNELASRNLKNVDVVFSVENQQRPGGSAGDFNETRLNFNIQKGFYNNRLKVGLSGDLGLYSDDINQSVPASHFIGNLSLDYQLFPGSPLVLTGAREEKYEGIIDGEITEYSLGVGFYKSYPTFWSIFGIKGTDDGVDD